MTEWQRSDENTFICESRENGSPDISFKFILPKTATQVQAQGDAIIYEVPARIEDLIVNSPFLILLALITVTMVVVIYGKAK